jgi:hypothetical protein
MIKLLLATLLTLAIATSAHSQNRLYGVVVDRDKLSPIQKREFEQYVQTANLPPTQVGKACKFDGKPQFWCLVLDKATADQVIAKLTRQGFSSAILTKPLRNLR